MQLKYIIIAAVMATSSVVAGHLTPTKYLSEQRQTSHVSQLLPEEIPGWEKIDMSTGIVNPQAQELSEKIYSETVNKIYRSKNGYQIMLSIAYGKDQRESMQVHKPEICYPAQGFQIKNINDDSISINNKKISVRRLQTQLGNSRQEPVTYWITLGDKVVTTGNSKKIEEIRYALHDLIADGMLVRISSIDSDSAAAFHQHDLFVKSLAEALSPEATVRMTGLAPQQ